MGIFQRHRHGHGTTVAKVSLKKVPAGCTVRMNVQILDGGVALDWTDSRLEYNDLYIWSDARRGIIGRPTWEVDSDDPTILHVTYTTASTDMPGTHKLSVDLKYNGWQMIHAAVAYWLVGNLYVPGSGTRVISAEEVVETDLTLTLHDVSTTYLQSLIDELIALRQSENERLTSLEGLEEQNSETLADHEERILDLEDRLESYTGGGVLIVESLPESGEEDTLYVDMTTRSVYVWDGSAFVNVGIGEGNVICGGCSDCDSGNGGGTTESGSGNGVETDTSSADLSDYAKKSDLDSYLPLAGGTMTGTVKFGSSGASIGTDGHLVLPSGVELY